MASDELNAPMRMSGGPGMAGPRKTVSAKEAKERRSFMADLMSAGLSHDEVVGFMQDQFPSMTEDEILRLKEKVRAMLLSEYEENTPLFKAMATRRIHKHIHSASKARQWGAVANLESQLSKIQGTESPTEQHITIDARLQQATLQVLGTLSPAEVQELVAEELKRMPVIPSPPSQIPTVVHAPEPSSE